MSLLETIKLRQRAPASEIVDVPEWGVTVEVRELDTTGVVDYLDATIDTGKRRRIGELVAVCSFDPATGERVFSAADVDDLMRTASGPVLRLFGVASRLNRHLFAGDGEPEKNGRAGTSH